jgi:hypothetical protein
MSDIVPVVRLLDEIGLRYRQPDAHHAHLSFRGNQVDFDVLLIGLGPLLSLVAYAEPQLPASRVDEAIRLANALNAAHLRWGALWIQPEQRKLAFEVALPVGAGVTREALELALGAVPFTRCWPAFAQVAWTGATAADALRAWSDEREGGPEDASPVDAPESDLPPAVEF